MTYRKYAIFVYIRFDKMKVTELSIIRNPKYQVVQRAMKSASQLERSKFDLHKINLTTETRSKLRSKCQQHDTNQTRNGNRTGIIE